MSLSISRSLSGSKKPKGPAPGSVFAYSVADIETDETGARMARMGAAAKMRAIDIRIVGMESAAGNFW
jgi:hypothetical protein